MIPHLSASIAFRWFIRLVFVLFAFNSSAQAQPAQAAKPISITGVYNGSYTGEQGPIEFKLSVTQEDIGTLTGEFTLYLPDGSDRKAYTCQVGGRYIPANRMVQLVRVGQWKTPLPAGIVMVGMNGLFDPNGGKGAGQISGKMRSRPGPKFQAVRDAQESAKMADAAAAKKAAITATAPPAKQPAAANRAAPVPSSMPPSSPSPSSSPPARRAPSSTPPSEARAAPNATSPTSIAGVYNGTYAGEQGPTKFKLSLTQQNNWMLAGEFTLYLGEGAATKEYTCSVSGGYIGGNRMIQLLPDKWETRPPDRAVLAGMIGTFDPAGGQGAGQFSGKMRSSPRAQFQCIRDAAQSAKMLADAASPTAVNGVYTGFIRQGNNNLKLTFSIKAAGDGSLTALFTFHAPGTKAYSMVTYRLTGKYDAKAKAYAVGPSPYQFTTIEPIGSEAQKALDASEVKAIHVGINASDSIVGSLTGSRPQSGEFNYGLFNLTKDRTASANLDKSMSGQASTATAPPAPAVHSPFEAVYNGAYVDAKGQTNKIKLTLWAKRDSRSGGVKRDNEEIAGLLTVFATDGSGTMPYTSEVEGNYNTGSIQVSTRWWEPPPSGITLMKGFQAKLDPGGGNAVPRISGFMFCPSNPKFQAVRDAAESARMDFEHLRNHVYPGIVGVFKGTYTQKNGGTPIQFKLSVTHNGDGLMGLAGMATIYLPSGSGTKAYTYDLKGVETFAGTFELRVHDWVSPPPRNFQNFKAMGFNGKVVLNDALTSAKMTGVPPSPSMTSFYLPQFEATYDATESADINGTLAAQRAVGKAEQVAAMKARDQMMKNAPPKELASKNLVRKSRQYWEGYQTDMIREVFDGGFGAAIDENELFEQVFCTYVDTFSAKCPQDLPADHQKVTITERTNRKVDKFGNIISEDVRTYTVDMDSRFVKKYIQFHDSLFSQVPVRGLRALANPGGAQQMIHDLLALATDMQRFFADHGGKTAAMRQMNENLLRAINGEPSLQQADGNIDGAEAESDKNLPPGRYARFVDAANSFFRAQAKANPIKFGNSSSHDTALCQRLAELYEFHMTREEEYYYANDFEGRFLPIMGPRASCPDPAWPELHPDVEKAIAEVK